MEMVRYEPRRLDEAPAGPRRLDGELTGPAGRRKPRRVKSAEPRRLVSVSRRPPLVRLLLMAAALTAAAMMGGTAARYLRQWSNDGSLVTAGSFYFTSDKLDGTTHRETASGGKVTFAFDLENFVVSGYATEQEIKYTCAVTDSEGNQVTDTQWLKSDSTPIDDGSVTGGVLSGTLPGGRDGTRDMTCSIPASAFGEKGDKELTVTAKATKPYAKELTARVALAAGNGGVRMVVTDRGGAVSVGLFNTSGAARTVELGWPATNLELVPDPTWETVPADLPEGADSFKLVIPADRVTSVVFLKKSTERSYGESDFPYTVSK